MSRRRQAVSGFTLIEVLVALVIMALIAALSWQGVDSMIRSRDIAQARLTATLRLQTVVAQMGADLAAVVDTQAVDALMFDGASLRMTRHAPGGVQLVVWSLRAGVWQRWASPAYTGVADLREAWMRSMQLLGNEPAQVRALDKLAGWQVYFSRSGSWTNAQSTGDVALVPPPAASGPDGVPGAADAAGGARQLLPQGVRVVLTPGEGSELPGSVIRDFLVAPSPTVQ